MKGKPVCVHSNCRKQKIDLCTYTRRLPRQFNHPVCEGWLPAAAREDKLQAPAREKVICCRADDDDVARDKWSVKR